MNPLYERRNSKSVIEYFYYEGERCEKNDTYVIVPELPGIVVEITELGGQKYGKLPKFKKIVELLEFLSDCKCKYYRARDYDDEVILERVDAFCKKQIPYDQVDDIFYYSTSENLSAFFYGDKRMYKKVSDTQLEEIELIFYREFDSVPIAKMGDLINEVDDFTYAGKGCLIKYEVNKLAFKVKCQFKYRKTLKGIIKENRRYDWLSSTWYVDVTEYENILKLILEIKNT